MENKKHICKYCGKEFNSGQSLGGHIILCIKNPNNHIKNFYKNKTKNYKLRNPIIKYNLICPICGNNYEIECSKNDFEKNKYKHTCSSKCAHKLSVINTNLEEKNKKISENSNSICTFKGCKRIDNKWVKNEDWIDSSLPRKCKFCEKVFYPKKKDNKNYSSSKFCSVECKNKFLSQNAKNKKCGGLKTNSYKKYKSGTYHNIHCDSSWELAFIIYCEDHNIKIERNKEGLNYIFENKTFKYYPDFIIDGVLYEIKGYEDKKAAEKHKQHPEVIYLDKYKMKKYLNYVINKYGKDFIKLYDKIDKT